MGANVSTSVLKKNADIIGQAAQTCAASNSSQIIDFNNVRIKCPDWCGSAGQRCGVFVGQTRQVDDKCVLDSAIALSEENLRKLTEEQQAGFGVNVSTDIKENIIKNSKFIRSKMWYR